MNQVEKNQYLLVLSTRIESEWKNMSQRQSEILMLAGEMIQTKGYDSFSYNDLSLRLGIRKASIHHHIPKKQELG